MWCWILWVASPPHRSYFKTLRAAGGHIEWYHKLRLHNWFMSNNRTHREITVVDGNIAFVGGAGYADWWRYSNKNEASLAGHHDTRTRRCCVRNPGNVRRKLARVLGPDS